MGLVGKVAGLFASQGNDGFLVSQLQLAVSRHQVELWGRPLGDSKGKQPNSVSMVLPGNEVSAGYNC